MINWGRFRIILKKLVKLLFIVLKKNKINSKIVFAWTEMVGTKILVITFGLEVKFWKEKWNDIKSSYLTHQPRLVITWHTWIICRLLHLLKRQIIVNLYVSLSHYIETLFCLHQKCNLILCRGGTYNKIHLPHNFKFYRYKTKSLLKISL